MTKSLTKKSLFSNFSFPYIVDGWRSWSSVSLGGECPTSGCSIDCCRMNNHPWGFNSNSVIWTNQQKKNNRPSSEFLCGHAECTIPLRIALVTFCIQFPPVYLTICFLLFGWFHFPKIAFKSNVSIEFIFVFVIFTNHMFHTFHWCWRFLSFRFFLFFSFFVKTKRISVGSILFLCIEILFALYYGIGKIRRCVNVECWIQNIYFAF